MNSDSTNQIRALNKYHLRHGGTIPSSRLQLGTSYKVCLGEMLCKGLPKCSLCRTVGARDRGGGGPRYFQPPTPPENPTADPDSKDHGPDFSSGEPPTPLSGANAAAMQPQRREQRSPYLEVAPMTVSPLQRAAHIPMRMATPEQEN